MGYLEGRLTYGRIDNYYMNWLHFNGAVPEETKKCILEILEYMKTTSLEKRKDDPYWDQVYNLYKQFQGMVDGYNPKVDKEKQLSYVEFQTMNSYGDYGDIEK